MGSHDRALSDAIEHSYRRAARAMVTDRPFDRGTGAD